MNTVQPWVAAQHRPVTEPDPHTCPRGPLCPPWYMEGSTSEQVFSGGCTHDSCLILIHEHCVSCFTEAVENMETEYPILDGVPACPEHGAVLTYEGEYGAPGIGSSWKCPAGCKWARIGDALYRPEWGAHLGIIDDFR